MERTSHRSGKTYSNFFSSEKSHHPNINRRLNTMEARVATLVKRSKNKVKDELEGISQVNLTKTLTCSAARVNFAA